MSNKLRVLTISKPYVAAAYRDKMTRMAADPRLEVGLIVPPRWGNQEFERDQTPPKFWQKVIPIHLNGKHHFHWYASAIEDAVREFIPDILNIEEEHYSLVTFQLFHLARKVGARPVFYTWQNIPKVYPPPFRWMESYVLRQAAGAMCGNQESLSILRQKGYSGPAAVIPQMGANVEAFAPRQQGEEHRAERKKVLGWESSKFIVLFAGRVVEEKGIQTLIGSLDFLPENLRRRVQIAILGDGPFKETLQRLTQSSKHRASIRFLPPVPSVQITQYLQATDVLCLPSLTRSNWKEQFGRILIEAMAAEAVVVGSSSGEIPHVIGDAGLVFDEGNPAALASCIGALAASSGKVFEYRLAGAQRVRAMYNNDIIAKKCGDFFCEIGSSQSNKI